MKDLLNYLPEMSKSIVDALLTLLLSFLAYVNITGDMTVKEALAALLTAAVKAFLTWLVPNYKGNVFKLSGR